MRALRVQRLLEAFRRLRRVDLGYQVIRFQFVTPSEPAFQRRRSLGVYDP